jgi:hypothetical protein
MNIFRPQHFPLASENIDTAPVNHPALVKISDQPSFSSYNFSPITSAEAVWSKREEKGLLGSNSDTPSDSDTELTVPLNHDFTEEDEEQDAHCVFYTVISLKNTMEKSGYDVRKSFDGCTHFVLVRRTILFVNLLRGKHCVVRSLYLCKCNIFNPVTILCGIHHPKLRTRMHLIRGSEAFIESNITRIFLFLMYDVYVTTISSLIKWSYVCALKSFTTLPIVLTAV